MVAGPYLETNGLLVAHHSHPRSSLCHFDHRHHPVVDDIVDHLDDIVDHLDDVVDDVIDVVDDVVDDEKDVKTLKTSEVKTSLTGCT